MVKLIIHTTLILLLIQASIFSSNACAVDVQIQEGDTLEMCTGESLTISGTAGFVNYGWTGAETLSGQTITPQFSGQYILAAEDGVGCISTDTIEVIIHPNPTPTINSSEGNPICPTPGGTLLSLSGSYASYDWGGGNTGSTFFASGPGSYSVTVVDNNGCMGTDAINITEIPFDLTTTYSGGCNGSTAVLQATGGGTYSWSTGETGQAIVVSPTSTTTYTVSITNGTCTETLSTTVAEISQSDYDLVDTLYMGVGDQEDVSGPTDGFVSYNWYPTGQISNPNGATVMITASSSFTLYMEATHSSGCVLTDSVVVIVVDLTTTNGFSPNSDGVNDLYVIPELETLDGSFIVWNRWGDIVFESEHYENNWDGTCQGPLCAGNGPLPEGTYYYLVKVGDIEYKGFITLNR